MPQRIEAVLKTNGVKPSKMYLVKWPLSVNVKYIIITLMKRKYIALYLNDQYIKWFNSIFENI